MAVAVTGTTGFVGCALVDSLIRRGFEVFPITRDVNPELLLHKADVVVHLGARVHVMDEKSTNPLEEFRNSNVVATSPA